MNNFFRYKIDHLIFWLFTIFFHAYTRLTLIETAGVYQFVLEVAVRNALLAGSVYLTILLAIPQLTKAKHAMKGLLVLAIAITLYVTGKNAHDVYLYGYILGGSGQQGFFTSTLYNLSIVLFYLAFATTLSFSKQWYVQREQLRKMEVEKLNTELSYLRAQMNPHFLFNAINTIYFQIDKQNQSARETLGKFSDMLRYQLYECNGQDIPIEKEVNYLKNYIELQQLRLNENYKIEFTHDPDLTGFCVPPLLLLPFVENAFKHVSHFDDRPNEVAISLQRKNAAIALYVSNTKNKTNTQYEPEGIGLKNVMRRLDLIYPTGYQLKVENQADQFKVSLQIPIP